MVPVPTLLPFLLAVAVAILGGTARAQRTPDEALRLLRDGNERFAADRSLVRPLGDGVRRTLAHGEAPFAVVLCCADSRVAPEHVFNCGLGELYVVRVAGHAAGAETIASVEHAIDRLGAPLVVVLAHEDCGAVAAAIAQANATPPAAAASSVMQRLLERIEPAVRRARERALGGAQLRAACEEEHAHSTVHDCLRHSELLRRHAASGRVRVVAARYQLHSGRVEWLPHRAPPPDPAAPAGPRVAPPAAVPPHVALRLLQAGHRRFLRDGRPATDLGTRRREQLAHGEQPLAIVLACADSRTPPEHLFDAGLGELFVVRTAGNALGDDALASIEYAACELGASLLVVLAHSRCSAVQAAATPPGEQTLTPSMRALLLRLEPAVAAARAGAAGRDVVDLAARAHALRTIGDARARSDLLRQLERDGRLALVPCVYDLATGDVEWLPEREAAAVPEAPPAAATACGPLAAAPHGETAPARAVVAPPPAPARSAAGDAPPASPWPEPLVLAGAAGVVALLAAALLALRRR